MGMSWFPEGLIFLPKEPEWPRSRWNFSLPLDGWCPGGRAVVAEWRVLTGFDEVTCYLICDNLRKHLDWLNVQSNDASS
ncbi:hypothetical protein Y1Q_0005603 [Alligator mississippiensis]|uniref:Uncharacterized protein n=1 Tax=Alligator mississippiensis TaxID=8496 RepID=A0A151MF82_ALLMI|nr:hypothetical protein Y1Q_0005603 [Alligator mississippiensis]